MAKRAIAAGPFVLPMPVVLVGADVGGRANFMTAAFLGIVNYQPATVACGLSPSHHTCRGILENRAFSLNLPPAELVEAADWCGLHSGSTVDKSGVFEVFRGEVTGAPMISACRLTAECRLVGTQAFAVDTVYFGEVVKVWADEEVLDGDQPDWPAVAPLLFTFPDKAYWRLGSFVARAWSVGRGANRTEHLARRVPPGRTVVKGEVAGMVRAEYGLAVHRVESAADLRRFLDLPTSCTATTRSGYRRSASSNGGATVFAPTRCSPTAPSPCFSPSGGAGRWGACRPSSTTSRWRTGGKRSACSGRTNASKNPARRPPCSRPPARGWPMGTDAWAVEFRFPGVGAGGGGLHPAAGLLAPYNPPCITISSLAFGLEKVKDLLVFAAELAPGYRIPERYLPLTDRVQRRYGVPCGRSTLGRLEEEIAGW